LYGNTIAKELESNRQLVDGKAFVFEQNFVFDKKG